MTIKTIHYNLMSCIHRTEIIIKKERRLKPLKLLRKISRGRELLQLIKLDFQSLLKVAIKVKKLLTIKKMRFYPYKIKTKSKLLGTLMNLNL